jgi:integrase
MPTCKLTDRFVAGLEAPGEYRDSQTPGFGVRLQRARGARTFFVRVRENGRRVRLLLGSYPDVSLADARGRAQDLRRAHDAGKTLVAPPQLKTPGAPTLTAAAALADVTPLTLTFAKLREAFVEAHAGSWSKQHLVNQRWFAEKLCGPLWDRRVAAEITRQEIKLAVREYAKRTPTNANRLQAFLSRCFNWAVEEDLLEQSPTVGFKKTPERARERVLRAEELRTFWAACLELHQDPTSTRRDRMLADLWRLRLLTAQREQALRRLEWRFFDWEESVIVFPRALMKGKQRGQVLPLVGRARLILERRREEATPFDKFVFATRTAANSAPGPARNTPFALPDFRGHDLRRTAATLMAQHGVTRFVVERVLAHTDKSITAVYDQYEYLPEKKAALETLDRVLTAILTPNAAQPASAPVLPFARL